MNEREQFEAWRKSSQGIDANSWNNTFDNTAKANFSAGWQAATALHQETINSLLAVIAKKDEALEKSVEMVGDLALQLSHRISVDNIKLLGEAIAITPEKVKGKINLNQINLLVENDRLKAELEAMRKDRNAIIEECAAVCDQFEIAEYAADEIRKLKVGE